MRAGALRHQITIQSSTEGRDAYGGATNTWATFAKTWASIEQGGGNEHRGGDQIRSMDQHVFTIRYLAGVTTDKRITWSGRTFDVLAVANDMELGRMLTITAVERAN